MDLLIRQPQVSVRDVARGLGLSEADETVRKAIRRVLKAMEQRSILRSQGAGRSHVYARVAQAPTESTKIGPTNIAQPEEGGYKDIPLSPESHTLLRYVSQDLQARTPVGYIQDFLRSYRPGQTFYFTEEQRQSLFFVGRAEVQIRPAGTYARNILNRLLVDLSWNSSRLEGNTYSLLETKRLIELGETATGKDATEAQMILNHKSAIEYIVEFSDQEVISSHEVCSIHALLSENLLGDPSASGRVRQIAVGIAGATYLPLENPHLLRECFELFIEKFNAIKDPFEQSLFSLIHLSYLQAFEDVNKRTARLVANIPLIKANLKPLSFFDVSQDVYIKALLGVYEKTNVNLIRDLYVWAYTRSSQRYSAIQLALGEPNLLKLKYRNVIINIIRTIILEKIDGAHVVPKIQSLLQAENLSQSEQSELFKVIETEISSLHDGNIARFKIRPSEFQAWKNQNWTR
jgi:Fic family protein